MKKLSDPRLLFALGLIAGWSALGLDAVDIMKRQRPAHSPLQATGSLVQPPQAAPEPPPPESNFQVMVERPLFNSSRRPPTANRPPAVPAALPTTPDFDLVGVLDVGGQPAALIKSRRDGVTKKISAGEVVNGWAVTQISIDEVSLASGPEIIVLSMKHVPPHQPQPLRLNHY